jgi:hypothetical protein
MADHEAHIQYHASHAYQHHAHSHERMQCHHHGEASDFEEEWEDDEHRDFEGDSLTED